VNVAPAVRYEGLTVRIVPAERRAFYLAGTKPVLGLEIVNSAPLPRSGTLLLTWNWNFREPTLPTAVTFTVQPWEKRLIPVDAPVVFGDGVVELRLVHIGRPEGISRPASVEEVMRLYQSVRPMHFDFLGSFVGKDPATARRERLTLVLLLAAAAGSVTGAVLVTLGLLLR
jgi:hypothetical protein